MIYSLTGKVVEKSPDEAVIVVSGVGYRVFINASCLGAIEVGKEATIFTYMNVKEDAIELYGFADIATKRCFTMLISVSGVGPRVGLSILNTLSPSCALIAISSGDFKAFTACSGVGPKLAQRIILELKDKVKGFTASGIELSDIRATSGSVGAASQAISALVSLGYSQSEAASAVSKLASGLTVEELLKQALRGMGRN